MASEMKWIEIKGQFILFKGNHQIRVATQEESIELEYKSSLEYKVSKMSFEDLLNAYVEFMVEYSHGLSISGIKARDTIEVYYQELLRRGSNL